MNKPTVSILDLTERVFPVTEETTLWSHYLLDASHCKIGLLSFYENLQT
jgi:hypothetical protein